MVDKCISFPSCLTECTRGIGAFEGPVSPGQYPQAQQSMTLNRKLKTPWEVEKDHRRGRGLYFSINTLMVLPPAFWKGDSAFSLSTEPSRLCSQPCLGHSKSKHPSPLPPSDSDQCSWDFWEMNCPGTKLEGTNSRPTALLETEPWSILMKTKFWKVYSVWLS